MKHLKKSSTSDYFLKAKNGSYDSKRASLSFL